MPSHKNSRLNIWNDAAEVTKLYNNRWRVAIRCLPSNKVEDWYYANRGTTFAEFADNYDKQLNINGEAKGWEPSEGEAWLDALLIRQEMGYTPSGEYVVTFIYETLTDSYVEETEEKLDKDANGFITLSQTLVAVEGTGYSGVVGTTTTTRESTTLYLSGVVQDQLSPEEGGFERIKLLWSQAGLVNTSSRSGPTNIPNTTFVTHESVGIASVPTGVLVESRDVNQNGFTTFIRTALQGTIEGVKLTYKDVADVRDAGTVNLTNVTKATGGISGTIAVAQVTPPRTKTLAATVTVEITTTPPDTVDIAYDLGDTSCSVTSISMSENFRGSDTFETSSGNSRFSGERKTADMSARISTYPECYLSGGTSSEGTFSYVSSYENISTSPNSIVAQAQTSTTNTFMDGTGSTSADYATTGVIKRNSRPVFTAIDGTVYYEVVTWTV